MSIIECLDRYPVIGFIGGNMGFALLKINSLLTDEGTIHIATNLAMYTGWFVAIITAILKCIELYEKLAAKYQAWRARTRP